MQIFVATGNAAEALSVLQSDKLGPSSSVFQQDAGHGYYLICEVLLSMPEQQLALEQCESILSQPNLQGSYDLWSVYVHLQNRRMDPPYVQRSYRLKLED